MKAHKRIIVALDVDDWVAAITLVDALKGEVGMFKVGKQLFTAEGPDLVSEIVEKGEKVFLDLKYHDIPATVAKASIEAVKLGVSMFNTHASADMKKAMGDATEAVAKYCWEKNIPQPFILGVTLLTSADEKDMEEEIPEGMSLEQLVFMRARRAHECGLDGVVASAQEASVLRKFLGRGFMIITPGVRSKGASVDDQKRVATPGEAVRDGATYVVIGRQITEADDPVEAARAIAREIETATN
ncbi:MAG: orotidine-5'-phosphate decarboxylase [Candidatus Doudnabacteria bacterium]|nr:orotidine-5'-phosphate decarboxylase [Candidatus Doudnabacteria bacterium]